MKKRKVPGEGTARRVREMLACDVTIAEIADVAGLRPSLVAQLPWREKGLVPRHVAQAIEDADRELMGPMPPPDDVDEVVVARLVDGDYHGPVRPSERREAVRTLREAGVSIRDTADRLSVNNRTVVRDMAILASRTQEAMAS